MYRSMMQVYVKNSSEALKFYQGVFGAEVKCVYPNEAGTLMHSELDVYGQILAIAELTEETSVTGNSMQFCLHFDKCDEALVGKIYDSLKDVATLIYPLGKCDFSPLMADFIDKYDVRYQPLFSKFWLVSIVLIA